MTGQKIDGILVANSVKERVKKAVETLQKEGIRPCLATLLVGNDLASATYVKNKQNACSEVGILTKDHKIPESISQQELNSLVESLNEDESIHGILLQLPLPNHLDEFSTTSRIIPIKDVDGLTPHNVGLLVAGKAILKPCTPSGIIELFDYYDIDLAGKHVVVINRSNLVGKPLYHLLLDRNATVTTCHSKTKNTIEHCKIADVIITAIGDRTKFILTPDMIKENSVIIDVGISRQNGKIVGDVDYDTVIKKAAFVTPVPGGVGPMTVSMLLKNTVTAASISKGLGRKN